MTPQQQNDLKALRAAASQREWNTSQDTFKRLITDIDLLVALQIPAEQVKAFLPIFGGYFPEAGWVKELLLTVVAYASAPKDLPVHTVGQFPAPGCGNFLMAVFDLARTVQTEYTVFERYSHLTNALANSILADLQHTYFSQHPEIYAKLRDLQDDDEAQAAARAKIQYDFWLDDEVAARDTQLWLHVADQVRHLLEHP